MKRTIIFGLIILFPAILLVLSYSWEFIIVDKCLDKGGSFNYINFECDMSISHPYVPFKQRNPALLIKGITSVLMTVVLAIILNKGNKSIKE